MEFERAKLLGDVGEQEVARELARLAPQYGMSVINDVLLKVGPMTAQLDHIIVDRFGLLILESKVRRGAHIKGNHVEKRWTACYDRGKNKTFQNPLAQNREHENALMRALSDAGQPLPPDYIKSAVVFVGADLSGLQLDALARARVVDVSELEQLMKARHDFALNAGDLGESRISEIVALITGLDRSGDPRVVEEHAAYRQGRRIQSGIGRSRGSASFGRAKEPSASLLDRIAERLVRLAVRAVVAALAVGLWWWAFLGPGQPIVARAFMALLTRGSTTSTVASEPSVFQAKAALQGARPEIYAALVDPDHPKISRSSRGTTFTWEYLQASGSQAAVKTVAVTLAPDGHVVGVSIP